MLKLLVLKFVIEKAHPKDNLKKNKTIFSMPQNQNLNFTKLYLLFQNNNNATSK